METLILLEAIRKMGAVPYPVVDNWAVLTDEIDALVQDGYLELSLDEGAYVISTEGKKALILFQSERKEIVERYAIYKEVFIDGRTIDARLPILAFQIRKQEEEGDKTLESMAALLAWDGFFEELSALKGSRVHWQSSLFHAFGLRYKGISRNCWRVLGRSAQEALLTCQKLLTPVQSKKLIQLTRTDG